MPNSRRFSAFTLLLVLGAACRPWAAGVRSAAELAAVPVQVRLDEETLTLESYLWRDFMPVAPPDGRPLAAVLRLRALDGSMSPGIAADSAWVVYGREVWATQLLRPQSPPEQGALELIARDGPKWPPEARVDVVVRVHSRGTAVLVRAANQRIRRTD